MNIQKHILIDKSNRFAGLYPCEGFGRCMCYYEQVN